MADQRIVLVTGAAKRIGRAIAIRLHQSGYRVAIHYGGSEKEARATAEECGSAPLFQADLEEVEDIRRMFLEVGEQLGSLYGLVNNAARFRRRDPFEITEADWDAIHNVNLKATFFCCQQGALLMKKTGAGRIVNISSLGGIRPWEMYAHYCASKAGVIMLTRALAKAFAPEITVNSVAPGVILASPEDPRAQDLIAATPAKRSGTPEEIADAVLYFMNATNFVTGQLLAIDGGLSQR
ncbi:MAG TPA: SDR family oxidoreductase [Bryobacteraceae bacterium]|jgi:NAD(P)-dependent dehydrogenase (short-subunit alcohol dehydrogenase family)|nr:SDR family oxidoreductase [Bryobacteraceae bacterium]